MKKIHSSILLILTLLCSLTVQAAELHLTFNCACEREEVSRNPILHCRPKLRKQDGTDYVMTQPFRYSSNQPDGCQKSLSELMRFDHQIFDLPEIMDKAPQYRMNLGLVRDYHETCKLFGVVDGVEYWKCNLETALAISSAGIKTAVFGKTVMISNFEPEGLLGARQPEWSAGLALHRINVLTKEFSKKTGLFEPVVKKND